MPVGRPLGRTGVSLPIFSRRMTFEIEQFSASADCSRGYSKGWILSSGHAHDLRKATRID